VDEAGPGQELGVLVRVTMECANWSCSILLDFCQMKKDPTTQLTVQGM